jgi:hypothetical protein
MTTLPAIYVLMQATYTNKNDMLQSLDVLQGKPATYYSTQLAASLALLQLSDAATMLAQVQIHSVQDRS